MHKKAQECTSSPRIMCWWNLIWRLVFFAVSCIPCYHVIMIQSFADAATEDIYNGRNTKRARRACPMEIWGIAARKLDQLDSAEILKDLRVPPGNRLEPLRGNRSGQYSIRINDQYRICFVWDPGRGAVEVEITDYH